MVVPYAPLAADSMTRGCYEGDLSGRGTSVDPELMQEAVRYVSGERDALVPRRRAQNLYRVFSRIEDRPRFLHDMHAYYTSRYAVGLQNSADSESDCTGVCLGCAGSIFGVGLGAAAIGASCGGVVLTGGGSLAVCWLAIVGGHATVLTSAASCTVCDHCLSRPAPEDPESPGNGGSGDPCDPCDGCEGPPPPSCEFGDDTPAAGAAA
jgi:hypothetical protein